MNQRRSNGANSNVSNNTCGKANSSKPNVPSKPQHFQGAKGSQMALPVSKDCVTPKGWAPQQKFTFTATSDKLGEMDEKPRTHSESIFAQKWRPAPKVMQKQSSVKQRSHVEMPKVIDGEKEKYISKYQYAEMEEVQNSCNKSSTAHSKSLLMEEGKGFGSLKRMWSQKGKSEDESPQQSPVTRPRSKTTETRQNTVPVNSEEDILEQELNEQVLSRSVSSSSNGSLRTASYKDKKATWHYVTAQSPSKEFSTDALPSKIDLNETLLFEKKKKGKEFDHKILAPRPFRATPIDEQSPASLKFANVHSRISPEKSCERNSSLSEDSSSSSGEAEDSDEKEMKRARKRGELVTKFDNRGNMYKIDPRTGIFTYVEDNETDDDGPNEEQQRSRSHAPMQRMNVISIEGVTPSESSTENHHNKRESESSNEKMAPPLLPRERTGRHSREPTVPPTGGPMRNSMTSVSMYPIKKQNYSLSHSENNPSQDGDSTAPPPLLPRGQHIAEELTQDYTPMSGSTSETPLHDRGSRDNIFSYSAAINPPKRTFSIREYHEIDPDPDVPIGPTDPPFMDPGSVPPPPDQEPPALPVGVKSRSGLQNVFTTLESPPPLPPMNQKRLHYIEVEIGKGAPMAASGIRQKPQKTNYTEVVVGAVPHTKDNDGKKGKSVKGKFMSMFSLKQDGYSSEGDVIGTTKHDDDRTTDFAKERNKLKRLSGRLLGKKKQKSREEGHQSIVLESSTQGETHGNVAVGLYGSATNLSTTSSESSRSLSQVASNGSSGDGQAGPHYATQSTYPRNSGSDRRRSDEPSHNHPPQLDQRSNSAVDLDALQISLPKSLPEAPNSPQHTHSKSAESTPQQGYQAQRSGRIVQGSPVICAPRVESQLHQQYAARKYKKVLPPSSRTLSEASVIETKSKVVVQVSRPASTQYDRDPSSKSPRLSKSHETMKVLPLTIIKDSKNENQIDEGLLSPNFPADAPPLPPVFSRPAPPSVTPPDLPPAPMRELKPGRFTKRITSGSVDAEYNAAEDTHQVNSDQENEPIYDDVPPLGLTVSPRLALSASVRSKLVESEPLYQVYRSMTLSHASRKARQDPSQRKRAETTCAADQKQNSEDQWQSDLMTDEAGATTLWREVKEVLESGVGKDLTTAQMILQQAQFEVVTSQASYMRSLNILIDHFMSDPAMENAEILPKKQRKELFSNIVAVREIEQRFLQEIEQHFWDKFYLTDIAEITAKYAKSDFEVYVRYVQNQVFQDRILTELQRTNDKFAVGLTRLETSPFCNKLPLLSFLLLPMQRVTRLPLLISAVVNRADSANDKKAYDSAKQALVIVNKLVKKCNESARKMQQTEQLAEIAKELVFAPKVKTYALVSQSRSVVKKGEMSVNMTYENRKTKAMKLWFFLFSDVLLLAKKRNFLEGGMSAKYEVIDWAKRAMLFINERAVSENEIFLVLLENCVGKRVELTLTKLSQSQLSRWTDAFNPQHAGESEDSIYESWDCPQYHCIVPYTAVQPDELTLDVGDVMRVFKKTGDGWLEGERLRDNEQGWFPADKCEEIEDEHVRARNLRNLYRIIPAGGATHDKYGPCSDPSPQTED